MDSDRALQKSLTNNTVGRSSSLRLHNSELGSSALNEIYNPPIQMNGASQSLQYSCFTIERADGRSNERGITTKLLPLSVTHCGTIVIFSGDSERNAAQWLMLTLYLAGQWVIISIHLCWSVLLRPGGHMTF